ncbi:hypothetical protein EDC48_11176 [Gibbsiella quercinecans]|nr:hypothetical protein EDC48_11176 [Gibbsiella quercinecans]
MIATTALRGGETHGMDDEARDEPVTMGKQTTICHASVTLSVLRT